ncbi:DUF448 domain-containing protein [Novosphingobium sp. Fuku2-ISO-50]|uniref:DUF448 domain-containing protein n=1 Tax=Novosphingobium sp. Fuku2-ISO-50 TaxID=1739114 RepID=UPI0009ECA205|nr:DUF448 domain-containing protein [Novosphingobium sp. Fuku2-ISO-50]
MRNPRNDSLTANPRAKTRSPASRRGGGSGTVQAERGGLEGSGASADTGEPIPALGPARGPAVPERKCILTGRHDGRDGLIRLALSPDGDVLPDVLARAPGRGAWIGVTRDELDQAIAKGKLKGALARAFKGSPLSIPTNLGARIESALRRALADRLGVELRSGIMVLGTEKIANAARSGTVKFLAHASDAGDDGSGKLAQAWRVGEMAEGTGMKGVILPLDRAALSVALGRDNVVHLALTDAAAAARVTGLLGRLKHFLGCEPAGYASAADTISVAAANDGIDTKGE